MAYINSIEVYLKRLNGHTYSGSDFLYLRLYLSSLYTTPPTTGLALGNALVAMNSIPEDGGWVTFTFSSPVLVEGNSFYTIHLWSSGIDDYDAAFLRWLGAVDWLDASTGEPYTGKARAWYYTSSWNSGGTRAFKVHCTGCDDVEASFVSDTENMFYDLYTSLRGQGVKFYLVTESSEYVNFSGSISNSLSMEGSLTTSPSKVINPTPANGGGNLDLFSYFQWEI